MTSFEIIQRIFSQVWAISDKEATSYLPLVMQIAKTGELSFSDIKEKRLDLKSRTETLFVSQMRKNENAFIVQNQRSFQELNSESFAVMRINGVIQKESDVCNKGLNEYAQELSLAGSNPLVKGVLLEVHSGGGTAFGGDSFAQLVADFEKDYDKPIAALITHVAASAAYEVIARAPRIFVDGETAEAGSIGTMTTLFNYEALMQTDGVKEIIVRASDSFNKNEEYYQAMKGNIKPLQENILNPLNKAFQNVVKKGRKGKLNLNKIAEDDEGNKVPEVLTGKVYFGKEIINMGLADEMGSRADALKYLNKQSKALQANSKTSKTKKSMFEILNKTEEELNQSLSQLDEKISQAAETEKESLSAEKIAIEKVLELKSLSAKVEELSIKNQELSLEAEKLPKMNEKTIAISQELEETKASLAANLEQNEANLSKLSELQAEVEKIQAEKTEIEAMKTEIEVKAQAQEEFISKQYGDDAFKALQMKNNDSSQPEPIVEPKSLTKKEEKYEVVRQSKKLIEEMTKGK